MGKESKKLSRREIKANVCFLMGVKADGEHKEIARGTTREINLLAKRGHEKHDGYAYVYVMRSADTRTDVDYATKSAKEVREARAERSKRVAKLVKAKKKREETLAKAIEKADKIVADAKVKFNAPEKAVAPVETVEAPVEAPVESAPAESGDLLEGGGE